MSAIVAVLVALVLSNPAQAWESGTWIAMPASCTAEALWAWDAPELAWLMCDEAADKSEDAGRTVWQDMHH